MRANKDRNGNTYELYDDNPMPPASNFKEVNKLHYELREAVDVINELLDRVYELEQNKNAPEPSGLEK